MDAAEGPGPLDNGSDHATTTSREPEDEADASGVVGASRVRRQTTQQLLSAWPNANFRRLASVKSEIHNVISALRVSDRARSANRFKIEISLRDEAPVVRKLKQLHAMLLGFDDLEQIDATTYFDPFLEVIRSPHTNSVVTGVALSSLNKLLLYGSLTLESPRGTEAVNSAVDAVASCRFEASHQYGDEIVLMQILEVLVSLLRCPVGPRISNRNVWFMIQAIFRMAVDQRISELLRAAAANHLSHVVLTIFNRAPELTSLPVVENDEAAAYGTTILVRALNFLAQLTDPARNNEATRAMGLQLVNIALETAGDSLGQSAQCVSVLQGDLCKFLLQNSQTDDLPVLSLSLRVVFNLFTAIKTHLKVQLEVFLTSVHFRIVESASASDEKKELALESLLDFCHDPALVLDLHANYDCDFRCSNLFEGLVRLLCRTASQSGGEGTLTALRLLALDGALAITSAIASRCDVVVNADSISKSDSGVLPHARPPVATGISEDQLDGDELIRRKTLKRRLMLVASQFNKSPCKVYWREYAVEVGVLKLIDDVEEVARFLHTTSGLDKAALGEFLSERDDFNKHVLASFCSRFSMQHLRIDEALRSLLESFRIPGEAQKIERVMEAFATCYFSQLPEGPNRVFASRDAVFVFAFSVVMLHTDAHTSSLQDSQRMTLDQFVRNNRGINDGADLPRELLEQVWTSVRQQEFLVLYDPRTAPAPPSADVEWDGVLRHSRTVEGARFTPAGQGLSAAGVHEKDMFSILFEPTAIAIDAALAVTTDGRVLARSLRGVRDLAKIAVHFGAVEETNHSVMLLCKHVQALPEELAAYAQSLHILAVLESETTEDEKRVAAMLNAVEQCAGVEGHPVRSLLVARCVLSLVKAHGSYVREAWTNVLRVLDGLQGALALGNDDGAPPFFNGEVARNENPPEIIEKLREPRLSNIGTGDDLVAGGFIGGGGGGGGGGSGSGSGENRPAGSHGIWRTVSNLFWGDDAEESENVQEVETRAWESVRAFLSACDAAGFLTVSSSFSDDSLAHLLTALSAPFTLAVPRLNPGLALELLSVAVGANAHRVERAWPFLDRALRDVLTDENKAEYREAAIAALFACCAHVAEPPLPSLLHALDALANLGVTPSVVSQGLMRIAKLGSGVETWRNLFRVVDRYARASRSEVANQVWEPLVEVVDSRLEHSNALACIEALDAFVQRVDDDRRAAQAAELIGSVAMRANAYDEDEALWLTALVVLRSRFLDQRPTVFAAVQHAMQRALDLPLVSSKLQTVFESVILPLLTLPSRIAEAGALAVRVYVSHGAGHTPHVLLPLVKALAAQIALQEAGSFELEATVQRLIVCLRVAQTTEPDQFDQAAQYLDGVLSDGWRLLV